MSEKREEKLRKYAKCNPMQTQMGMKQLEAHYVRLKAYRETIEVVDADDDGFAEGDLRSKKVEWTFCKGAKTPRVWTTVRRLYKRDKPRRVSVTGIDADDLETTHVLGDNKEIFERFDYDEMVETVRIDKFVESRLMRAILEYKDHPLLQVS